MERDKRTKGIKKLIESKDIKTLVEILDDHDFPVTSLAKSLRTNTTRMRRLMESPGNLTFDEADAIAFFFDVREELIVEMIRRVKKKGK
ncbi:MAG: hypothetical protein P0Y53_15860 [Candidatus Pseudobacter hemicellulosilyticus]|uniref:Uncharacterized protein n=1 Tax=Candidatus Pseudobacter hemicellulosilyticus TaxID=3121375 RepID=A0AAJ6BFQ9_9BACT|nr:MAG: hypothetical protein P0Y53_15860 [Pseudobacter sp.]